MFYKYFHIQTKSDGDKFFTPNKAQIDFNKKKTKRNYILKARQLGFSTLIKLSDLDTILSKKNTNCLTISDTTEHAEGMLEIISYAWNSLPEELRNIYKERYKSRRQLYLDEMKSGIKISTSGRSGTVQRLHISEWAFFNRRQVEETITGSIQAVPEDGIITFETTANGINHAKEDWDKAEENGYKKFFYNWTWSNEYRAKPVNDEWRKEYKELAHSYRLIENIQERFKLTDEQFYWYFLKARALKDLVKQEYPTIPEEAFLTSGLSVFDLYLISQIETEEPKFKFKDVVNLWQDPEETHKYIIGMDTAEGVGSDSSSLCILDTKTLEQVGEFASNTIEPHEFAELGVQLAKLYNNAYIVPERNASGLTTVTKIRELQYPNMFISREVDKISKKVKNEYGWRTSSTNRDLMIDEFIEAVHEGRIGLKSKELLSEMRTFVRKDSGKREHEDGKHDDRIFAAMLALQGLKTQGSIVDLIF